MASSKTVSKGIRIKNEVAEYFKDKPLNRYIESLYEHIQDGLIEEEDGSLSVHTKETNSLGNYTMTPAVLEEFESAGKAYGMTGNELGRRIMLAMDLGLIFYEDNQFKAYAGEEYDLSKLKEACKEKGVPVQKAIDKAAQMVWNG